MCDVPQGGPNGSKDEAARLSDSISAATARMIRSSRFMRANMSISWAEPGAGGRRPILIRIDPDDRDARRGTIWQEPDDFHPR